MFFNVPFVLIYLCNVPIFIFTEFDEIEEVSRSLDCLLCVTAFQASSTSHFSDQCNDLHSVQSICTFSSPDEAQARPSVDRNFPLFNHSNQLGF